MNHIALTAVTDMLRPMLILLTVFCIYRGAPASDVNVARFDGSSWNREIAFSDENVLDLHSISMTLDSSDQPHISFYDRGFGKQGLQYVHYDGFNWQSTLVDPNASLNLYQTSIKLTSAGEPRISYTRTGSNSEQLRYASFSSGVWTTEVADGSPRVGHYSSLALDSSNNPHISYFDFTNGDLKLAVKSGTWRIQAVDSAGLTGYATSIQLFEDKEHIAYYLGQVDDLRFAERSDSWNLQTVDADGNAGVYNSLALDASGNPRIAYRVQDPDRDAHVKFAEWNPNTSSWDISLVDSGGQVTGFNTSLAIGADGTPHISYFSRFGDIFQIRYATRDASGNWVINIVDDQGIVTETSISLDSNGLPVIAYGFRGFVPEPSTLVLAGATSAVALIRLRRQTSSQKKRSEAKLTKTNSRTNTREYNQQ